MRPFNFDKPLVESSTPPQDVNVYWVDVDEPSGILGTISEFVPSKNKWEVKWIANITDLIEALHWPGGGDTEVTVPDFDFDGSIVKDLEKDYSDLQELTNTYNTVIGHITTQTGVLDEQVGSLTTIIESLDPTDDADLIAALTTVKTNVNSASSVLKGDIPTD